MTNGFNLLDDPWIVALTPRGEEEQVSILDLFERAPNLAAVGGEVATQNFAITRLLLAFLHRAIDGPEDIDAWTGLWHEPELPLAKLHTYADRFRRRFDLFDAETPFFQVPGLHTANDEVFGLERIVADTPNGEPFFTMRSAKGLRGIPAAEAARWLVHVHAFDPSGIKSGAVGDPKVKGGKGYPIGVGWSGQLGGVLPAGWNVRETLLLNLIAKDFDDYLDIGGVNDVPPWERDVDAPTWEENRPPEGAIELYTWQSRRVRLVGDATGVTGVVLANGDKTQPQNRHRLDPHTAWRYSDPQTKKFKTDVYMPKTHDPERSFWRGLEALLPSQAGRQNRIKGGPARFLAPAVLQWLGMLSNQGRLPAGFTARTQATGVEYGPQSATITDVVHDSIDINVTLLQASDPALARVAVEAISATETAAFDVWKLAENIARAAGASAESGAGDRARELAYAAFDAPFRSWLAALGPEASAQDAAADWQRTALKLITPLERELCASAGPAAWLGREFGDRHVTLPLAQTWFRAALRKTLPLAHEAQRPKESV